MPAVKERKYRSGDQRQVMELYRVSIHQLAAPYYSPEQLEAWAPAIADADLWEQRLAGLKTVVAVEDKVIAGFASHTKDGYLYFIFTHPSFARRGVATRLYSHVEGVLRVAGVPRITTHSSLAARAFFERQGFTVDAEENVECRGAYLRRFAMHKDLAG